MASIKCCFEVSEDKIGKKVVALASVCNTGMGSLTFLVLLSAEGLRQPRSSSGQWRGCTSGLFDMLRDDV